jgi:hypothetical protein
MRLCVALLGLIFLIGCEGCRDSGRSPAPQKVALRKTDTGKRQQELLQYALGNLERLQEFYSDETQNQIVQRAEELRQADAAKKLDPLTAAWPEPPMLHQIVDRLNQWIQTQTPPPATAVDPAVAALPKEVRELPLMRQLDKLRFVPFDGFALQEAVWLRDASASACGETVDDLTRARNLFDWTVRNIQIEPDAGNTIPQFPWEAMLLGRGTAWERAWVFILLARQQGLDAAVLAITPSESPEAKESGKNLKSPRPWCVGVRIEKKVYLFDPLWGLPIPGPDGVKFNAAGQLDVLPATLDEAQNHPEILKRMDADAEHPYPWKAADLKNVTAWVEASPTYLARRMKLLEPYFTGKQKLVLGVSPTGELALWEKAGGVSGAGLWLHPFETLQVRSALPPMAIQRWLYSFLPLFAYDQAVDPKQGSVLGMEIRHEQADSEPSSAQVRIVQAPLFQGRVLYLKGQLPGDPGAMKFYQLACPSREEIANLGEYWGRKLVEKYTQDQNELSKEEALRRQSLLREEAAKIIQRVEFINLGKQDATYWLGLTAYERGNYSAANYYLYNRTLEVWPRGMWARGARYNYARSVEAGGDFDKAISLFHLDEAAEDYAGQLLRAQWLQERPKKEK